MCELAAGGTLLGIHNIKECTEDDPMFSFISVFLLQSESKSVLCSYVLKPLADLSFFFLSLLIYWGGGAERETERQRIPRRLHSVSAEPDLGLDPMTLGS